MIKNSLRQMLRTPIRVIMFFVLIAIAAAFLSLGTSLWLTNIANIKEYEDKFMTIGTIEQKGDSITQTEYWDAEKKDYLISQRPVYSSIVPLSKVTLPDFDYIQKPEKRSYYGSYGPEYTLVNGAGRVSASLTQTLIAEFSPLEDCIPNQSIQIKITKIIGNSTIPVNAPIWFCMHWEDEPEMLYKDKTYIASFGQYGWMHGDVYEASGGLPQDGREFVSREIEAVEYNANGTKIKDEVITTDTYFEVTDGFYDTNIGKRYLELTKVNSLMDYIFPVTGTHSTNLLMSFYNKQSFISEGRDISDEEFANGKNVCLISKTFAQNNNLTVGNSVDTHLSYTNAAAPASNDLWLNGSTTFGFEPLGSNGKVYTPFEDNSYKIVGIYETSGSSSFNFDNYELGADEMIVPMNSIKHRDSNNIVRFGPMRGNTTSFQIANGAIPQFMEQWEKLGNDNLEVTFYDMGYSQLQSGIENMRNIAILLLGVGALMVVFLLLFFTHLFITKQKERTAIERCMGMTKGQCRRSLLIGLVSLILLGGVTGSLVGGILSQKVSAASIGQEYYSTKYSNISPVEETTLTLDNVNSNVVASAICASAFIIILGVGISLSKINKSLRHEPMQLLSEKNNE